MKGLGTLHGSREGKLLYAKHSGFFFIFPLWDIVPTFYLSVQPCPFLNLTSLHGPIGYSKTLDFSEFSEILQYVRSRHHRKLYFALYFLSFLKVHILPL